MKKSTKKSVYTAWVAPASLEYAKAGRESFLYYDIEKDKKMECGSFYSADDAKACVERTLTNGWLRRDMREIKSRHLVAFTSQSDVVTKGAKMGVYSNRCGLLAIGGITRKSVKQA